MATADTTARSSRSRPRTLVALLAVSAVLNLFFIAGALWTRMQPAPAAPSVQQRHERMARELDLDPRQRAGFDRYVAAMRTRSDKMHQEIAPLIAGAWDEMAKPQPDQGRIVRQFDDASQEWRAFQHESTTETLDFLSLLSPDQRSKFIALARERRAPWLHARHHER